MPLLCVKEYELLATATKPVLVLTESDSSNTPPKSIPNSLFCPEGNEYFSAV